MSENEKFYITTPIYYVNDRPHIGHAYTTIAADVLARYHRSRGHDVFFLTGTDENSQKNVDAAEKAGESDIQKYLDDMAATWKKTWEDMKMTNDDFIRTTEDRHKKGVEKFWNIVAEKGDIYEGEYEGLYCTGCEAFYKDTDLVEGNCPMHKKPVDSIKEKNYFFKLTKYRDRLIEHIEANPDFIQPESRRNEVLSYVRNFMEDTSVSRSTLKWGIPVPGDDSQVLYVWFDALVNYLTGVGYGTDDAMFAKHWPAEVHLVGKDIIKFHCALWPAMLMAADLPLPKKVFAHGFFTVDGDKMSKSLGNAIDPVAISEEWGHDVLRYYVLREIPFGSDGDFSFENLGNRYRSELANGFGNLLARVLAMVDKYFDGKLPAKTEVDVSEYWEKYETAMQNLKLHEALEQINVAAGALDSAIDTTKPWELAKAGDTEKLGEFLYTMSETLRMIAVMLRPFMPETSEKMLAQLNAPELSYEESKRWGMLEPGTEIHRGESLFPRRDS